MLEPINSNSKTPNHGFGEKVNNLYSKLQLKFKPCKQQKDIHSIVIS